MAELKTKPTADSVEDFLNSVADARRRQDSFAVLALMKEVTGMAPRMWGTAIIGFGDQHYKYATGREGDTFIVGFSPRKEALTLYLPGYLERFTPLLQRLGKHKTGKGCLYIKALADVDLAVLRDLLVQSTASLTGTLPPPP